ncbi:MAG: UDP-N-acetylmuramate--L-alanine ligase [Flavobacteriaceae bacterium]|nr:UDP-N-acetylmuramate--L-alanine ligase [Flavobacteriaceae bacterium]
MKPLNKHHIYFIGIGGIGMSALAFYAKETGHKVAGYDKTETQLTQKLSAKGISVIYEDDIALVDAKFLDPKETLVVFTPAIPESSNLLNYFKSEGFEILKRSELLGQLSAETKCLAVGGTHGKTTTSTLLAHLLKQSGMKITAILGGISLNYDTNLILDGTDALVVEADEYDRSFLRLHPFYAAVTSTDADHLDIYKTDDELQKAFQQFTAKTVAGGKVFVHEETSLSGIRYGFGEDSDYQIKNLSIEEGIYQFDIQTPDEIHTHFKSSLLGKHNLLNTLLAFAMAYEWGVSADKLREDIQSFKGVERRFAYHIKTAHQIYIDDYAHHPSEIAAVREALESFYPNKAKTVIFQPHLFSRTQDFGDAFARELAAFDQVILLEIYPAREHPIPGIDAQWLLDKIDHTHKKILTKEALLQNIKKDTTEVLITLGAGDISTLVEPIKKKLT